MLTKLLLNHELIAEQCPPDTQSKLLCLRCGSHHTIKNGSTECDEMWSFVFSKQIKVYIWPDGVTKGGKRRQTD